MKTKIRISIKPWLNISERETKKINKYRVTHKSLYAMIYNIMVLGNVDYAARRFATSCR